MPERKYPELYEKVENELSQREKLVLKNAVWTLWRRGIHAEGSRQTTGDLPFLCIPDRKERGRKATRLFLLFVRYHICPPSDPAPHITPVLSEEHSPAPLLLH